MSTEATVEVAADRVFVRLGNYEFEIVVPEPATAEGAADLLRECLSALSPRPFPCCEHCAEWPHSNGHPLPCKRQPCRSLPEIHQGGKVPTGDATGAKPPRGGSTPKAVTADLERFRVALERIAHEDYRGNRPWSATVAAEALDG